MAYKINSFNYGHIRNSIFKNGLATTSKAYGIDKTTLRYVKDNATFEQYRNFIAEKSREQYERRIKKQRERMFGNGLHFDGKVEINKSKEEPKETPFETTPELGLAKTIVTEVKEHERPADLTHTEIKPVELNIKPKQTRKRWPDMTPEMFNIALDMARKGHLKQEICDKLGYPNAATLNYQLTKNSVWASSFSRACEDGKELYKKRWGEKTGSHARAVERRKELGIEEKPKKMSNGKSSYIKGLETGAKKMGMTVEDYQQWRVDKLIAARGDKKRIDAVKKEEEEAAPKYKETYAEMIEREYGRLNKIEQKADVKEEPKPKQEPKPKHNAKVEHELEAKPEKSVVHIHHNNHPIQVKETAVRGINSLLESLGQAIKVIAIGVLVLLLAQAAQIIINSLNSSQIKIDPSTCEYTNASGIEYVKCSKM